MRRDAITNRSANFGKSRRHRRGSAGGVSGAWSKKAQATAKKQEVNLRKVKVYNSSMTPMHIMISMKTLKKAKQNQGRLSSEYTLASFVNKSKPASSPMASTQKA